MLEKKMFLDPVILYENMQARKVSSSALEGRILGHKIKIMLRQK